MARVSKQLLANRLKFAAEATGHRVAKSWNDVGGLQLGQQYGGVQIEMVSNPGGGIHTIGPRMRATDMADALQIVSELHYFAKKHAQVLENPSRKRARKNPPVNQNVFSTSKISMRKLKQEISDLVRGGHVGFSVSLKDGEYRLQEWRNGKAYGSPYFTNDAQDVIDTARFIRKRYDGSHR